MVLENIPERSFVPSSTATGGVPQPEPSNSAAHAASTQLAHLKVGVLLPLIWPLEYEKRYWTSEFFRGAANGSDNLHLFIRLVFESLLLIRLVSTLPDDISAPFCSQTLKKFALLALHVAFKALSPGFYAHCRWVCVAHFRYLLAPAACFAQVALTHTLAHGDAPHSTHTCGAVAHNRYLLAPAAGLAQVVLTRLPDHFARWCARMCGLQHVNNNSSQHHLLVHQPEPLFTCADCTTSWSRPLRP
jgi:hypothetical protein